MPLEYETLQDMVKSLNLQGHIVEIGVLQGDFAADILDLCPGVSLITLVDCWQPGALFASDQDGNNGKVYDNTANFIHVLERFFNNKRAYIVKDSSEYFFQRVADNSLDAVYITNLSDECIYNAYRTVKPGGWIMGWNYTTSSKCKTQLDFSAKQVVDEFCATHNQSIHALTLDGCVSYAIQKTLS